MIKLAVVTGSEGYIGRSVVQHLLANDVTVFGVDLASSSSQISPSNYCSLDLTDSSSFSSWLSGLTDLRSQPFTLIHLAGIDYKLVSNPLDTPTLDCEPPADFEQSAFANISMTYACLYSALDIMSSARGGNIILFGSIYGSVAPHPSLYTTSDNKLYASKPFAYSIAKSTFPMFAKLISSRYSKRNISCVNLEPHALIENPSPQYLESYSYLSPSGQLGCLTQLSSFTTWLATNPITSLNGSTIRLDSSWSAV